MKTKIKNTLKAQQNGHCALSPAELPDQTSLYDTDRIKPKAEGGTYHNLKNVRAVLPLAHMKRHDNLSDRSWALDILKAACDDRRSSITEENMARNRLLAYTRQTDSQGTKIPYLEGTVERAAEQRAKDDDAILEALEDVDHPMLAIASAVGGVGPITIAHMLAYVDITKANTVSSLWAYVGLSTPARDRFTKGVKGGGNQTLRTVLYCLAEVQMKGQPDVDLKRYAPYRSVYDRAKLQKEQSKALVLSRNTQGKEVEVAWKDTKPCHRHGHALRIVIKHFLSDWWFAHRTVEGLHTRPLYVEEKLGHTGITQAKERGWIF